MHHRPAAGRRGSTQQHRPRHVAVIVGVGSRPERHRQINSSHGKPATPDWSGQWINAHHVVRQIVSDPDFTIRIHSHPGRADSAR